jgi:hypothetical protein
MAAKEAPAAYAATVPGLSGINEIVEKIALWYLEIVYYRAISEWS